MGRKHIIAYLEPPTPICLFIKQHLRGYDVDKGCLRVIMSNVEAVLANIFIEPRNGSFRGT